MLQPCQHVQYVFATDGTGLENQRHRDQHGLQSVDRDGGQHLGHGPTHVWLAQQGLLQRAQRFGHGQERRAVAQRAGLALHDGDVVLPVVVSAIALEAPLVARDHGIAYHHDQLKGVHPQAGDGMGVLAGHAVAVAIESDQCR